VNLFLVVATLVVVAAVRNRRAKTRLLGSRDGQMLIPCSVRRTYGQNRPSVWVGGEIQVQPGQPPIWTASPDQENARIVMDPLRFRRVPADRTGEVVLADVVTLVADDIRIEISVAGAEAAVLKAIYVTETTE
jgi:hypothetical protein